MSITYFDGYTVEDWLGLPEDGRRWELHDGALHVTPPPFSRHALIVARVRQLLDSVLPETALAVDNLGVHASRTRVLIPDLAVVERDLLVRDVPYVQGTDLWLAVEVESPSSVRVDRLMKSTFYAEGGVPLYLRIVPEGSSGPEAHLGRLVGDSYRMESAVAGELLTLGDRLPVSFDPADLVR